MDNRRWFWRIATAVFAVAFVVSGSFLVIHLLPDSDRPSLVESRPPSPSSAPDEGPVLVENPQNFADLQAQNPEIVGWIAIPGTHIDYPILQSGTVHPEEDYYLDHDRYGQKKKAGSIYIQQRNSDKFTDPNTVIYGHNMGNGSMFADLHQFRTNKNGFFDKNDTIYIYAPGKIFTYRIYSAFLFDDRHILNSYDFHSTEGYSAFLQETLSPSSMIRRVREGVTVTDKDRIITLSTCYAQDDERYLVVGVLVNEQDTF